MPAAVESPGSTTPSSSGRCDEAADAADAVGWFDVFDVTTASGRVAACVAVGCGLGAAAYVARRIYVRYRRLYSVEEAARRAQKRSESKVLYLIRHGQSTFNAAYAASGIDPMLFDAPLSELGERQVAELNASLTAAEAETDGEGGGGDGGDERRGNGLMSPMPEVVLTSPLTRALQTALGSFEGTGVPLEVLPDLREHLTESCDVGRPVRNLVADFPSVSFSTLVEYAASAASLRRSRRGESGDGKYAAESAHGAAREDGVDDVWWYVDQEADASLESVEACQREFMTYGFVEPEVDVRRRVNAVIDAVRRRPEKCIALVGHADFFNMLAARIDPRGDELWLEPCGVASYTLPPLPSALRSVPKNKGSAAA